MNTLKEIIQLKKELLDIQERLKQSIENVNDIKFHLQVTKFSINRKVCQADNSLILKKKRIESQKNMSGKLLNKVKKTVILYNNINKKIPPKRQWVADYCKERENGIDPDQFFDFYQSRGWLVGKLRMKDWHAAVRTWERYRKGKEENKPPIYDDGRKYIWDSKIQRYRHSVSGTIYIP